MDVKKIEIVTLAGDPVAVLRDGENWHDPHGGVFSADEISQFEDVLLGEAGELVLDRGTKYENRFAVRLRVDFMDGGERVFDGPPLEERRHDPEV
jgi:hypothetical protein